MLPNGCQIDGSNSYNSITNTGTATTHEDQNCEKIQVKMRYFDQNLGWTTAVVGYSSLSTVSVSRLTNQVPDWSDHNGRANGSDWGFRLQF